MSNERYTISKQYCDGVGDGLRYAYGGTDQYYPSQWENAIKGLKKTLQAKTVTPGASQQVIEPDSGYDGLTAVTVSGDADLVAGNIKKDVEIFGVTGTFEGGGGGRVTQDENGYLILSEDGSIVAEIPVTITQNGSTTPPSGYAFSVVNTNVSGGGGSGVNIPVSLAVTTQPTKASYTTGEALDLTGIVVTATYADGTTGNVTSGCTFSPANGATLSTAGTQTITATYSITDTSSGHNYTVTLTATTTVTVSVVSGVRAKRGDSGTIVSLSGLYGPMGDAHADYLIPIDANGNEVTIDNTQPFEYKVTFRITQNNYVSAKHAFRNASAYAYIPTIIWGYNNTQQECQAQIFWGTGSFYLPSDGDTPLSLNEDVEIVVSYDGTDLTASMDIGTYHETDTYTNVSFSRSGSDSCGYAGSSYINSQSYQLALAGVTGAYLNIDKCYIKQNGTLIWGVPQS